MGQELEGRRILFVDDNEELRVMFGMRLEISGAVIALACSAADALGKLDTFVPEAVVLDRGLPEIDGIALLGMIRARDGLTMVPALMMSGFAREADHQHALANGFDRFLPKPVLPDEMIVALAALLAPR